MITTTNPQQYSYPITVYHEQPYCKVEIEAKDHTNIYHSACVNWTPSTPLTTTKSLGSTIIGIAVNATISSATLTQNITITDAGYYRMYIRGLVQKWSPITTWSLSVDSSLIETKTSLSQSDHYKWQDYGLEYLTAGTHTFQIGLNGPHAWVESLILHRVETYSTDSPHSNLKLDIQEIEFTQNSVNELNTATINLTLNNDWFIPGDNLYSNMVFDLTDSINIWLGNDSNSSKNMFGGYVIGYSINEENTILTLECMDRLMDLYREPAYLNYAIGVNPRSDEQSVFPHLQFGSAIESIRYLIESQEYGINSYKLAYPYGFIGDYGDDNYFNTITVNGFSKHQDKRAGNPPPCLRLGLDTFKTDSCGSVVGTAMEYIMYENTLNPYDAFEKEILFFNYMASGLASNNEYKLQFNVEITMHKAGQTVNDATTYNILFTGKPGASRIIGSVSPVLNGKWQEFKVNLKTLFDSYAPSSAYHISKIRFTNTITQTEIDNRNKSIMYIDNPHSFDSDINKVMHIDQETDYPFLILQKICDEMNYTAYIEYANERKDDCLVIAPEENQASTQLIVEGKNVVKVYNKTYSPKETIANRVLKHFHYTEGETEYTGNSYAENLDSIYRYGPWQSFEDLSDVSTQIDANTRVQNDLSNNAYGLISFSMDIIGSTLLEPSQYVVTSLGSHYLNDNYKPKSIIHTINLGESPTFRTQIDIGKPSNRFKALLMSMHQQLRKIIDRNSRGMYDSRSLKKLGFNSPASFIKIGA